GRRAGDRLEVDLQPVVQGRRADAVVQGGGRLEGEFGIVLGGSNPPGGGRVEEGQGGEEEKARGAENAGISLPAGRARRGDPPSCSGPAACRPAGPGRRAGRDSRLPAAK